MEDASALFDSLEKVAQEMKTRRAYLNSELSKVDREITDIEHYIEFYPLNACQGYKAAKMMKDCRVKLRDIKMKWKL